MLETAMVLPYIRDLTPADAVSMLILREEALEEPLMGPRKHREHAATTESISEWLAARDRVTIGAFAGKTATTLLGACTVRCLGKPSDWGLTGLYVTRNAQGAGLGKMLVQQCLTHPFASSAETFVLEVYSSTMGPESKAKRIYRGFGFKNSWDPEQGKEYPPGLSKYTMFKRVGSET